MADPLTRLSVGALIWLAVGVSVVLVYSLPSERREAIDAFAAAALWPFLLIGRYLLGPFHRWKRERARQRRLTARVAAGHLPRERAYEYGWKGDGRG